MRHWPTMMQAAVVVLLCAPAFAADSSGTNAARLSFTKSFPGSQPAYESIVVERDGALTYNESDDPDNAETFRLEPQTTSQMFELADKLDHFKKPLESGLKVANMGQKTFRWESGDEKSESKFNYSLNEDARVLSDDFEHIAESVRLILELRRDLKHDRLGVDATTLKIQTAWNNKHLVATPDFLPLLDEVAKNEALIHMARERSAQIADAIRSNLGN